MQSCCVALSMQQHDGFWYYEYRVANGQYPIYARCALNFAIPGVCV